MRRNSVKGCLLFLLFGLLLGAPFNSGAQPLDPQSLIGAWIGTWKGKLASVSGPYELIIESIDGEKVRGHVETTGAGSRQDAPVKFRITGLLQGNHLTYGTATYVVDLEIRGSQMRGTWSGFVQREISLTKK
jgi:hypothetical protein